MTKDSKHQVLYALYAEYQQDIPNMAQVNCHSSDMDVTVFNASLLKLQNEGYIRGLVWNPPDTMDARNIRAVSRSNIYLTGKGVEYVEKLADIESAQNAKEKIKKLASQAAQVGLPVLADWMAHLIAG